MTTVHVFDANDAGMREHCAQPYLLDFVAAHGIDPGDCVRFDVLPDGDGQIVFYCYAAGPRRLDERGQVAMADPVQMPLVQPVPAELWERRPSAFPLD